MTKQFFIWPFCNRHTFLLNLYKGLCLCLMLSVSLFAYAENDEEIGKPYFDRKSSEGRVDSMVLAPTGERAYTLKNGVLYQYDLNPLKKISFMKVAFDTRQTKEEPYRLFITNNEERMIIYSKKRLRLLDMESGKIVKTLFFKSEQGVLNDEEFLTLDNDNKGTVWDANQLTKKKEFVATGGARWLDIRYGNLIKASEHIILYRQSGYVSGKIIVFDGKAYDQVWRIQHKDDNLSSISYDRKTLYIKHAQPRVWRSVKYIDLLEEYRGEDKIGYPGEILKLNLSTSGPCA